MAIVIYLRYLIFSGFSFWPFVFIRKDAPLKTILHELIHHEQQKELFVLPAFFLYWAEYLLKLACYWNFKKAYYAISFEREAFSFEHLDKYYALRNKYYWLTLVFMSGVLSISHQSADVLFEELFDKAVGSVCTFKGDYTQLLHAIEAYRSAHYPDRTFEVTQLVPGNSVYPLYGPNSFVVYRNEVAD